MIPTLLWQCPLCHTDDALVQKSHWFRADQVRCTYCQTTWEVQRVLGSDYLLRVVDGDASQIGHELPLAEWYDLMKADLRLISRRDPTVQLPAEEQLYVRSHEAALFVEEDNPLPEGWRREEAPSGRDGDLSLVNMKRWDRGRLCLTSERFIWVGERGTHTFWLRKVNSAHIEFFTYFFSFLYGLRRYRFRFRHESVLKWLTYTALVARRIAEVHLHDIHLTNY